MFSVNIYPFTVLKTVTVVVSMVVVCPLAIPGVLE